MHKEIEALLDMDFQVLKTGLVGGNDGNKLSTVIKTLVDIINGSTPYKTALGELYKTIPELEGTKVKDAISDFILLLYGKHHLVDKCFNEAKASENNEENSYLTYCAALFDEMTARLHNEFPSHTSLDDSGMVQMVAENSMAVAGICFD